MNKSDLYEGQTVYISGHNRRGKVAEATVVKVGTKLVHIKENNQWARVGKYRIEDQTINDGYGHDRFRTAEQKQADEQTAIDIVTLNENGFSIRFNVYDAPKHLHAVAEFLRSL